MSYIIIMESIERKIRIYETPDGKRPFVDWLESLDIKTQTIVNTRIDRVALGNFGDCKPIVASVKDIKELRIQYGAGFRVYFGEEKTRVVILLCGGAKRTQKRDIKKAVEYWKEYRR